MRAWYLWILVGCACGAPAPTPESGFIALDRDFAAYETWESLTLDGGTVDGVHTAGLRQVFLNARPDAGAQEWPVGTVLVKVLPFTTFAMVKRGAGYNTKGAPGWEWFELFLDDAKVPRIKWRGLGPPLGENYSKPGQTCNDCHGANVSNDSVMTPALRLGPP